MKATAVGVSFAGVLAGVLTCVPAGAAESDTLRKIKEANAITIGHRDTAAPFSYFDANRKPIGYSIDLCLRIVEAIKVAEKLPDLEVRFELVSGATRIPLTANGRVDLECGTTTNTVERQRQVAFTVTTFLAASRIAWKKSDRFKTLDDLKGKSVSAVAGTTNLRQLTEINAERRLGMKLMPTKHHDYAFDMLEKGRADAFISDDILLYGIIAASAAPGNYEVSKEALSIEPYGIMLRRNDPAFRKMADDAIRALFASGEIHRIYKKWFLSPIPPNNITLNLPMSDALTKVIVNPTNSGHANDYR